MQIGTLIVELSKTPGIRDCNRKMVNDVLGSVG